MKYKFVFILIIFLAFSVVASTAEAERKSRVLDQYTQNATYVVKKGDWLSRIAAKYDAKVKNLAEINGIEDPDKIYSGRELVIPVQGESRSAPKQEKKRRQKTQKKQKIIEKKEKETLQTYTVQSGDTIWELSQRFDVPQAALVDANDISDPSFIREGEELRIPRDAGQVFEESDKKDSSGIFHWQNPGADPFTNDPEKLVEVRKALHLLGFSQEQVSNIAFEVKNATSHTTYLQRGDRLAAMVFGNSIVEKPVICAFEGKEAVAVYTTPTLDQMGYALVVPEACHNFSLLEKKMSAPIPVPEKVHSLKPKPDKSAKNPPPVKGSFPSTGKKFPEVPVHPGTSGEEDGIEHTKFEAYMGGGYSEPAHGDGKDQHIWSKARYRPFWWKVNNSTDIGIGMFVYGAMGAGEDGDYSYDWRKAALGPNVKVMGEHWDADLDFGVGTMTNEGEEGKYQSEQDDDFWYISSYASFYKRRNEGKKWFPETNFGLEATVPFNTDHDHSWDGQSLESDPWDNQYLEASVKQGIYDFKVNGFRLTPETHASIGHSWGQEANFYKVGPGVSAGYKGYDILTMSAFNYQEYLGSDADSWSWVSLTVDIGNAYKAWKASQIEKIN